MLIKDIRDTLWPPTVQHSFSRKNKKINSINREGIRIIIGTFTSSPVESLNVEAYEIFEEILTLWIAEKISMTLVVS